MAALFRVKALYEYTSPHEDDLTFDAGQVITVTEEEDEDWYGGEYTDANGAKQEGIFPRNFVEKIEPTAPPRPARARPKKDSAEAPKSPEAVAAPTPAVAAAAPESEPAPVREPEPEPEPEVVEPEAPREKSPPPQPAAPVPAPAPRKSFDEPKPASASVEKPKEPATAAAPPSRAKAASPPPVSDKPLSNSFKDRIAAFNKPAAPPVAPFKPTGLSSGGGSGGGTGFIKKPFVAAPPSRDAYVPPPQQAPVSKIYRRDEDPEIREKEEENKEQAERAGLAPTEGTEGDDEDQPKPTTLKERIALLQKQQQEQAQRHADTAAKKEKPKKPPPPKKAEPAPVATEEPAEEEEGHREVESSAPPALPRRSTEESARRSSTDDASADAPPPPRRKASKAHALEPIHDGNEADMSGAGDTTEGQDDTTEREDDEPARQVPRPPIGMAQPTPQAGPEKREDEGEEEDDEEGEEEEEDEDVDPEIKRKEELRARMAKMSGGMGFHGMFGMGPPPGGAPPNKKKAQTPKTEAPVEEAEEEPASPAAAPPVPAMIPVPGMGGPPAPPRRSGESARSEAHEPEPTPTARAPPPVPARQVEEDENDEDDETTPALTPAASATHPPPPVPGGRPAPPPVPAESRPPPPPPPGNLQSPSEGSASGDEMPAVQDKSLDSAAAQPQPPQLPPMPPQPAQTAELPLRTPTSPGGEEPPLASPTATTSKRNSRPPPPIPGSAPAPPPASSRPPPPPPPGPGGVSRQSTADIQIPPIPTPVRPPQAGEENESEATEYEGDYDTDIGSSVPHKDALKAHARDSSQDDNSFQSPTDAPSVVPPPIPQASAPKAVPPPVPSQPPPPAESKRRSVDMPRAAPPPPPPAREPLSPTGQQEDYDPYNYSTTPGLSKKTPRIEEEAYFPDSQISQSPPGRPAPQQMPSARSRQSLDVGRKSMSARRSMDAPRPTGESGFIAEDMELAVQSGWWKQANQVPPVLQGRRDIFYECDESTTTNQGAKTEITREIWILFQDYSQTILTIRYDPYDPTDVDIEQRHEPPPRPLRQDQMEDFYERFGRPISEAAASKKDSVVGDGSPQGFILELLRPHKDALPPVGTRAFGALVYSNMANASTSQNDAIRPGDIISIRNAKFQGKHGPMHAKYSVEVGKPDHVGVVAEWDGTKKKVRAWEQGRESKKVKMESFKLDDLRSGEVRIWRVMPRGWVGWNSQA